MVTKIDNTASSAPQLGLGSADLVVEELVEGGMTRLAVFFYSDIPGTVGPVRSMRASDIGIVSPVEAQVVTSGAAPVTINRVSQAGIKFFGEGAAGFSRASDRSAPYNLMADLSTLLDAQKDVEESRPDDYLPWGDAADLPKGKKATTIAAGFGGHTTNWVFRDGGYVNENSYAADGDEFPTDTVLVLRVQVGDAGYTRPGRQPVPETKLEGQGAAFLFHDGKVVTGDVEEGRPQRRHHPVDQAGQADRPRRPHLDRAGPADRRHPHLQLTRRRVGTMARRVAACRPRRPGTARSSVSRWGRRAARRRTRRATACRRG